MTIVHALLAAKVVGIATSSLAVAIITIDPTVQVAIVTGIFLIVAQIPVFVLGCLNRKDVKASLSLSHEMKQSVNEVKQNTNGVITKLFDDNKQKAEQVVDATDKLHETAIQLSYVKGQREGSDRERIAEKGVSNETNC